MTNVHDEARKVAGFDCSVIPAMTDEQIAYLENYNERLSNDDLTDNPTIEENKKYFAHVMLQNANRFKDISDALDPEGKAAIYAKMDLNYEDQAEANYLKYLQVKNYM